MQPTQACPQLLQLLIQAPEFLNHGLGAKCGVDESYEDMTVFIVAVLAICKPELTPKGILEFKKVFTNT
ncbi:hypothetical protein KTJ59_12480 [Acinetobacter baumannii]|nr:hypothetical protein [Acinetobacter baumannii]